MKVLAALVLAMGVSWGAITTASAEPPGDASPLVGKWCLERPRALKYGSRLGLVISSIASIYAESGANGSCGSVMHSVRG